MHEIKHFIRKEKSLSLSTQPTMETDEQVKLSIHDQLFEWLQFPKT